MCRLPPDKASSSQPVKKAIAKKGNGLSRFERFATWLSSWFERIAIVGFLGMMAGTFIDVVGAKAFHYPLPAGLEVVYFCQLIAIGGALAYGEIDGRHIRIELFVDRLPRRAGAFFHGLAALLGLGLFSILTWKTFQYALSLRAANEVTATSRIIVFPFAFWLSLCFVPLCLVLVVELMKAISEGIKR
jgi:TRAP-type C4-dicarboxylate transport system permease small subunit